MGYRVKATGFKKGPGWKLQLISYTGGKRSDRDIPKTEWMSHGFSPSMSIDDARALASSINEREERQRLAERKATIQERLKEENQELNAHFPPALLAEFERTRLSGRRIFTPTDEVAVKKRQSHWKAAKALIVELKLDYPDWSDRRTDFYDYFAAHSFSYSYVQKVLRLVNEWGKFCSKQQKKYFEHIPLPSKRERERINDRYFNEHGQGKESSPLTLAALESKQQTFANNKNEAQWNWLYCASAFGLRPHEADKLKDPKFTSIYYDEDLKCEVLKVYQPKLVNIKREDRFKYIPCKYPEQVKALGIIRKESIERPLETTVNRHFGETVNLYGPRKNFEDLMNLRDEPLDNISAWLGHQTVDRTWRNYRNKRKARNRKAAA